MKHESIIVRIAIVSNLSDILSAVREQQELLQPVLACLARVDNDCAGQWRIQQQMLLQCARLCNIFNGAEVQPSAQQSDGRMSEATAQHQAMPEHLQAGRASVTYKYLFEMPTGSPVNTWPLTDPLQ